MKLTIIAAHTGFKVIVTTSEVDCTVHNCADEGFHIYRNGKQHFLSMKDYVDYAGTFGVREFEVPISNDELKDITRLFGEIARDEVSYLEHVYLDSGSVSATVVGDSGDYVVNLQGTVYEMQIILLIPHVYFAPMHDALTAYITTL
jgi:hypothetical protein